MQIILLMLITLMSHDLSAKTLKISHAMLSHELTWDKPTLVLKGPGLDLTLAKTSCNQLMIQKFESRVAQALRVPMKNLRPFEYSVKIENDGDIYYESIRIKGAQYLMDLPNVFRALKLQNKYKCEKP